MSVTVSNAEQEETNFQADFLWEIQYSQAQFFRISSNSSLPNCASQVFYISRMIYIYGIAVGFAVALLLNGVMVVVFMAKNLRKYAFGVYLSGQAVLDLATLTIYIPKGWIQLILTMLQSGTDYVGYNTNSIVCRSVTFLGHFFKFMSGWCLIALGYSRISAMKTSGRLIEQQTTRSARLIIVYITCLGLLINGHVLFTWSIIGQSDANDDVTFCGPSLNSTGMALFLSVGTISANTGIPTLGSFLLSIYLIKGIRKEKVILRRRLVNKAMLRLKRGHKMSQVVLALCGATTVLGLPQCICWVVIVLQHLTMERFSCSQMYSYAARDLTEVFSLLSYTCKLVFCMMSGMSILSPEPTQTRAR